MLPTVYLAGPIKGLSYVGATEWREQVAEALGPDIVCYSPMRSKGMLKHVEILDAGQNPVHALTSGPGILSRDHFDVVTRDLLFVNFLGATEKSLGTTAEIAWAWHLRKPIVTVMEQSGNPHDHAFILEMTGFLVHTLEEAIFVTKAILLP